MGIMNCFAICQVAGFSASFQNPEGIAAVCSIRIATKTIDWCISWGQWVYAHTDPQPAESIGTDIHKGHSVNVAV